MAASVSNVALYLSERRGTKSNYSLVLQIFRETNGIPNTDISLGVAERSVSDIVKDDWYVFSFSPNVELSAGSYVFALYQKPDSFQETTDMTTNFVEWFHSEDVDTIKTNIAFSTDLGYGYDSDYISAYLYGYGYGDFENVNDAIRTGTDYFDVLGVSGNSTGYGHNSLSTANYGYGYGYENIDVRTDYKISRTFKIYEDFNNLSYITTDESVIVNIPLAEDDLKTLNNRQDFVHGEKNGTEIVNNTITLADNGERFYVADATLFNSQNNKDIKWHSANHNLSINDINNASIINSYGNTSKYQTWIIAAPIHNGIYFSTNSGSNWTKNTVDSTNKNFGNVLFGTATSAFTPTYVFDNTDDDERGKVFYSEVTSTGITNDNLTWTEKTRLLNGSTGLNANHVLFNGSDIWVATNNGIYISTDSAVSWTLSHLSGIAVNQIAVSGTKYYAATQDGCYVNISGSWSKKTTNVCYSVHVISTDIFIGTETGLLRSTDNGVNFYGNDPDDSFYPQGLLKSRTTFIGSNSSNTSELYVAQYGGVFISENGGGNFHTISNSLKETRVRNLLLNPITNRTLYAITETLLFSGTAITFAIDCSGSMLSNDPNNRRLSMAKKIIRGIAADYPSDTYFQIIAYGIEEKNGYNLFKDGIESDEDFIGAEILTSINGNFGFVSGSSSAIDAVDNCDTSIVHKRTPLWDSIDAMAEGLNKHGASWRYDAILNKYVFSEFSEKYFSELHKAIIIITDGHDTVAGKTSSDLITQYSKMRGDVYIIGIGFDINYENLGELKEQHSYANLYLASYDENINRDSWGYDYGYGYSNWFAGEIEYIDVAEIILDKERLQNREGTYNKIIDYSTKRRLKTCDITSNVPSNTTCKFKIRNSLDKDIWSNWTSYTNANTTANISTIGKYFEIEILFTSNSARYSPEVSSIIFTTLEPKENLIYMNSQTGDNETSQIHLSSLDDISSGVVSENDVTLDFGYIQSTSPNYSVSSEVTRDKRSIITLRDKENLITTDGYFYYAENGVWAIDDINSKVIIYDGYDRINQKDYNIVPSLGLVVFYERQINLNGENKTYEILIPISNSYRIGMKLTNFSETISTFNLHDISWMYYTATNSSTIRKSLPIAESQLKLSTNYGKTTTENHSIGNMISTNFSIQYIIKEEDGFSGTLSFTTGDYINIETDSNSDPIMLYYNQNAFLNKFQTSQISSFLGTSDTAYSGITVTLAETENYDNRNIHYKVNIPIETTINQGEVLVTNIGGVLNNSISDVSTTLKQNNLLVNNTDTIYGETETSFIFGTTNNVFDRIIEPKIKYGGQSATNLVIVSPTTAQTTEVLNFSVLAVDAQGLIDRDYEGSFTISFDPSSFCFINTTTHNFIKQDNGIKVLTVFINSSSSGVGKILATLGSKTYKSNPIRIVSTDSSRLRWGDLNIKTIFSEGRQNIDFIADYAREVSQLDFIGLADDLDILNDHSYKENEWEYIKFVSEKESTNNLIIFPGFTHKTSDLHGERVILFENFKDIPDNLPSGTKTNMEDPQLQIEQLLNDLNDSYSSYISVSVRTNYKDSFSERGFNFENYRKILLYGTDSEATTFVEEKECVMEIYSEHGFNEELRQDRSTNSFNFTQENREQYLQHALYLGKKFGFVGGSGGYSSRPGYYTGDQSEKTDTTRRPKLRSDDGFTANKGLTAILSSNKGRTAYITALKDKQCYATTGAKIYMTFSGSSGSNNVSMGSTLRSLEETSGVPDDNIILNLEIVPDKSTIKEIKIIRIIVDKHLDITFSNLIDTTYFSTTTSGEITTVVFTDDSLEGIADKEVCYYARIEQNNKHVVWSSPIWFNFGREDGILESSSEIGQRIFQPSLTNEENTNYRGTLSSSEDQSTPLVQFSTSNLFPDSHQWLMLNGNSVNTTVRRTYLDYSLYVSDKIPEVYGMRVYSDNTNKIVYGTHHQRMLFNSTENTSTYTIQYSNSSLGPNKDSFTLKYLGDSTPYKTIINDSMPMRNKLFGYVWQYSNDGLNIKNSYSIDSDDTIVTENGTNMPIVRDPYMFKSGNNWHMFYSAFIDSYPENEIDTTKDKAYDPTTATAADGRTEDFAGLLEVDAWENISNRIYYVNTLGTNNEREFNTVPAAEYPTTFDQGTNEKGVIAFSSSPSIVALSSGYRLYYLGWFKGGTSRTPVLGMFCHEISSLDSVVGEPTLCFVFTSDDTIYPSNYTPRQTSVITEDFIWSRYKSANLSSSITDTTDWSSMHPAYSIGFVWSSVIKRYDDVYYAFFNKNVSRDSSGTITGLGGTGILYSEDGLNFREYDHANDTRINDLTNLYWSAPFANDGKWYLSYRDNNELLFPSKNPKINYALINWTLISPFILV